MGSQCKKPFRFHREERQHWLLEPFASSVGEIHWRKQSAELTHQGVDTLVNKYIVS